MDHAPHSSLSIEQRQGSYLKGIVKNIDVMSDISTVLVLQIEFDRKLIATYLDRAHRLIEEDFQDKGWPKENFPRVLRQNRGVVFNGELVRDFQLKAYSILVASHLADPLAVSTRRVVIISGGGATSERFRMHLLHPNNAAKTMLRRLSHKDVLDFLWARPGEIAGKPKSQFMMGLSYISQIFRGSDDPLITFMWSLAAIEAMLSTTSDKANSGTLELRLRALLNIENDEHIVGRFRNLYRYRNAIFHGNVALPHSFDSRNLFGFSGIKHSDTIPFEIASFTYALALKILQRFFELRMYDIRYDTVVQKN